MSYYCIACFDNISSIFKLFYMFLFIVLLYFLKKVFLHFVQYLGNSFLICYFILRIFLN